MTAYTYVMRHNSVLYCVENEIEPSAFTERLQAFNHRQHHYTHVLLIALQGRVLQQTVFQEPGLLMYATFAEYVEHLLWSATLNIIPCLAIRLVDLKRIERGETWTERAHIGAPRKEVTKESILERITVREQQLDVALNMVHDFVNTCAVNTSMDTDSMLKNFIDKEVQNREAFLLRMKEKNARYKEVRRAISAFTPDHV